MGLGVAVGCAARHADAAAAKPDRERSLLDRPRVGVGVRVRVGVLGSDREPSLVIQRRWVSPSLTMGTIGWCSVHASTHRVLLHRPLRDAEHGEGQTGAAELDAKSHPTGAGTDRVAASWRSLPHVILFTGGG